MVLKKDNLLLNQLKEGNERAFTEIYNKYCKEIFSLALCYLKDADLAEDIVQRVFLKLWELHAKITVKQDIGNYLYKMAKNDILKMIQEQNKRIIDAYELEYIYNIQNEAERDPMIERKLKTIYEMIEKLPQKTKEVFLMKVKDELKDGEIAKQLSISVQTVKNHYNQALKFLRRNAYPKILLLFCIKFIIFQILF